jgi:predicted porin
MKKSLFALAALTTIAGTAQAQSSVTLFGLLDAGAYYINGVTTANNNAFGVLGNTISTSNWGLKGTEDLGGGLSARFYAESGINSRNGALGQSSAEKSEVKLASNGGLVTLFDRGFYVGVQGNWGALDIGNKVNPLWSANSAILPVSGNSVSTNTAKTLGFGNSNYTHNSLTYTLPTMSGFNAAVQWGFGNALSTAVGGSAGGSVLAASADYTVGGFSVRAAGQKRWGNGTYISANFTDGGAPAVATPFGATSTNQTTYLVGAKYAINAFTLGAGWIANDITPGTGVTSTATNNFINNAFQVGVGYQATPAVLLGLNWVGATSGSNLINAQGRYAFSKRTQAYAQVGYASNKTGLNNAGLGNFLALDGANGQTGTTKFADSVGPNNFNQLGLGVGLIHTF